ncbi:MAG TPA: tyrosine--tRNA ligase, partial [Balneolales bacterium]|nr:tyrosine--tRNA ligase [Balneolales bacterium]
GRHLQREEGQEPQVCLMMPRLIGTDGTMKMSKSYDNYIGITEAPNDMYGKALSIPDDLIYSYFELLTDIPLEELPEFRKKAVDDPRNTKHDLAFTITRMYHGEEAANEAKEHFQKTVINKEIPDEIPEFTFDRGSELNLVQIIRNINFATSNSEAKRLIQQGGVTLDGDTIDDIHHTLTIGDGFNRVIKVGKRKFGRLLSN